MDGMDGMDGTDGTIGDPQFAPKNIGLYPCSVIRFAFCISVINSLYVRVQDLCNELK